MTQKILVIGPAWVGDMVMAQSLLKLLKQKYSDTYIHVIAPPTTLSLLKRMPEVSDSTALPIAHGQLKLSVRYQVAKKMRPYRFDQAIVLANSFKSALIPKLAGISKRTGWSREGRFLLLNDVRHLNKKKYPLMVERYLALGLNPEDPLPKPYPYPELISTLDHQTQMLTKLKMSAPTEQVLALCPGAEFGPAKQWPSEYFAELARKKLDQGWKIWLLGSPKDNAVNQRIMDLTENHCVNFSGKTSLEDAIDLLALSTVVVSNDSGLMHIAAALKKPVVAVYGATSPYFTPPLSDKVSVLKLNLECQPCFKRECPLQHHRCMVDLTPAIVLNALQELRSSR